MNNTQQQNLLQLAEQLADTVWPLIEQWSDFAKQATGGPLLNAVDHVGLQLSHAQGSLPVKQHMQLIGTARKGLLTVDYYLKRALRRGLLESSQADLLRSQLNELAQRLDQHAKTVVSAAKKKIAEDREKNAKLEKEDNSLPAAIDSGAQTSH